MLPDDAPTVREGDEILFRSTESGELMPAASMNSINTLDYLVTGVDRPRGYLFQWLGRGLKNSIACSPISNAPISAGTAAYCVAQSVMYTTET